MRPSPWLAPLLPLLAACPSPEAPERADPNALLLDNVPSGVVRFTSEDGCFHPTLNPAGTPLQQIVDALGPNRVLVVDETCAVSAAGLHLPERFTLTGAGWTGAGTLVMQGERGLWFDSGADQEVHGTVSNLQIQGTGAGTGISLIDRHQVHLRDLTIRGFTTAILADTSFSVTVEHCNLNQNGTGIALGTEANAWRILGGLCSQNDVCMDLHPGGDGNDTLVMGVRMESNGVAVQVGGLSTYIAFNRFEGNGQDVVRAPTSEGTALLANNTALGTSSDLSELNAHGLTGLPLLDGLQMSIAPDTVTTALETSYAPDVNALRTVLATNQVTDEAGDSVPGYHPGYAGWELALDGGAVPATSEVRFAVRAPGAGGPPVEVARIAADGTLYATAFAATSDARRKDAIAPIDGALDKLGRLRGVRWTWAEGPAAGQPGLGLVAQDVEAVFPEAVGTARDGTKTVRYDGLTGPIVEAIRELARENAALRARVAALEGTPSP